MGSQKNREKRPALSDDGSAADSSSGQELGWPPREIEEYRVVRRLGEGGMGKVYLARDSLLEREVAIKFMTHHGGSRRARFAVEARAAARLQHPNIVSIYRVGQLDRLPYIVSEYVEGQSLAELSKPLPWQRALEIALAMARGLAAAHRRGVLHRDIKPDNVILSASGEPKIADFGLAKIMDADDREAKADREADTQLAGQHSTAGQAQAPRLTRDGALLGTPYYMAPETWLDAEATLQSDVYSFGALLYELCAGFVPHSDSSPRDLALTTITEDPPPLAERALDVDPGFAAIIDRCLARNPDHRYASCESVLDALVELQSNTRPIEIPAVGPYRGLLSFEAEHRALFFGRESDIRQVIDRLRTQLVLLVAGESGAGKSSLVRAGCIASHRRARAGRWPDSGEP